MRDLMEHTKSTVDYKAYLGPRKVEGLKAITQSTVELFLVDKVLFIGCLGTGAHVL